MLTLRQRQSKVKFLPVADPEVLDRGAKTEVPQAKGGMWGGVPCPVIPLPIGVGPGECPSLEKKYMQKCCLVHIFDTFLLLIS